MSIYIYTGYTYPITSIFPWCLHKWPTSLSLTLQRATGRPVAFFWFALRAVFISNIGASVVEQTGETCWKSVEDLKMNGFLRSFLWTFCGTSQGKWTFAETLWTISTIGAFCWGESTIHIYIYIHILSITESLSRSLTSLTSFDKPQWPNDI